MERRKGKMLIMGCSKEQQEGLGVTLAVCPAVTAMAEHWIHGHGKYISMARFTPAESKASASV